VSLSLSSQENVNPFTFNHQRSTTTTESIDPSASIDMDPWSAFGDDGGDSDSNDDVDGKEETSACQKSNDVEEVEWALHESLAQHVVGDVLLGRLPFATHTPRTRLRVGCVASKHLGLRSTHTLRLSVPLLKQSLRSHGVLADDVGSIGGAIGVPGENQVWDALLLEIPIDTSSTDPGHHESLQDSESSNLASAVSRAGRLLVAGGVLVLIGQGRGPAFEAHIASHVDDDAWEWDRHSKSVEGTLPDVATSRSEWRVHSLTKKLGRIQQATCPWLSRNRSQLDNERARVLSATIPISAHEAQSQHLTEASIARGVEALESFGYCIVPRVVSPEVCCSLGRLVLEDLHDAAAILRRDHGVDLYNPGGDSRHDDSAPREAGVYRELSLREDCRVDLRNGPRLDRARSQREHTYCPGPHSPSCVDGNDSWVIRAETPLRPTHGVASSPFLRGHPDLLEIVRRGMNPTPPSSFDVSGNWGRFNFNSSTPGTYQDVRVGRMGAIVSLPSAADQALHADTPHLFEIDTHLPPHYVNAFCPAAPSARGVGQTALVHASHKLDAASRLLVGDAWHGSVVRPCLEPGDVLLFDCRILHFGLANSPGSSVERPILYTNITMAWFHDPKNWDDQQRIFRTTGETSDESGEETGLASKQQMRTISNRCNIPYLYS
jgi:hypothetical protein